VPGAIHVSLYEDETSRLCRWHVPQSHFLEAWGDVRGHDGTIAITQPLIEPLYQSLSPIEVAGLLGGRSEGAYDLVRETYADRFGDAFESKWNEFLRVGVLPESAAEPVEVSSNDQKGEAAAEPHRADSPSRNELSDAGLPLTLIFRPDPTLWDGRYANNGWLQELPKPLTKLTWGNAAILSPKDAKRLGAEDGDIVAIRKGAAVVELPVFAMPLQAEGCATLHLGHGRESAGNVAAGSVGKNVNPLRSSSSPWTTSAATLTATGRHIDLAGTQSHFSMEGDHLVRGGTLDEWRAEPEHPHFAHPHKHSRDVSLYPDWKYDGHAWGMSIDLTACTGCGVCVIACQAENNIPVVGRGEVLRKREMHWIRVDTYFEGSPDEPERTFQQPVPCMHCELAPCEPVCPVAATVHSGTGLNQMVYNRCIGTRYCSNNCPYKVRRFNFLAYSDRFHSDPVLKLLPNPDVTVRSRGVMEKCTYCVQRIERALIASKVEKRPLKDGDIVTACQQVCPTGAIRFGDINDKQSRLIELKTSPLTYALLEELNTRPRTTYLAEVQNVNEELKKKREQSAGGGA
jgi:molybdopterin-containing oxidoreductase family iron-sulfur binding subunit